ncbi:hypothetical protein B7R54_13890 [Subtercola boreus]|uniref:Histidine kinase/HSP90-like ATPase domain-containing protein n=1 Tax=Subtercola boreus TaxID=120213 RepID=A0A3E0VMQ4_9MICO|nr:hypothetical protein B7R54_13890 [Subtercola boreus]TQL52657.1 signal transduction histidine kinase [Subtercola boreus]
MGSQTAPGRFRLGAACARGFGVVFCLSAMLNLAVPELSRVAAFAPALIGLVIMVGGFILVDSRWSVLWAAVTYVVGLGTLATFLLPGARVDSAATVASVTALASTAIPSLLVAVADRRSLPYVAIASLPPVLVLAVIVTAPFGRTPFVAIAIVGGWIAMSFAGLWLARSVKRAETGLEQLQEGYAAERRSTETEAERRYGARVLHDTVLATLTVIAHSGVGVPPRAIREQAASDSALLAQLRTAGTFTASPSGPPDPSLPGAADDLHRTVDRWSASHDFTVTWHGDDRVAASPTQLDALTRAVAQCLENVRRHSGEVSAEVTISQDDRLVRAVVTDTGSGFERALVPEGRLGLAESIEARIAAVGGVARVFSSPGHGTTVLLEIPR